MFFHGCIDVYYSGSPMNGPITHRSTGLISNLWKSALSILMKKVMNVVICWMKYLSVVLLCWLFTFKYVIGSNKMLFERRLRPLRTPWILNFPVLFFWARLYETLQTTYTTYFQPRLIFIFLSQGARHPM